MLRGLGRKDAKFAKANFQFDLFVSSLALLVLELVLPIITLQVYDRVLPNASIGTLNVLVLGGLVALICDMFLRFARLRQIAFQGFARTHDLNKRLMQSVVNADFGRQEVGGPSELGSKIAAAAALRDFGSGSTFVTLVELSLAPLLIGLIALIGGRLALIPLFVVFLFSAFAFFFGRRLSKLLDIRQVEDIERFAFVIEHFNAAHTLKALSMEKRICRAYEALKYKATIRSFHVASAMMRVFDLSAIFTSIITFSIVGFGAMMSLNGNLTAGGLIACILLSSRIMAPIQKGLSLAIRWDAQLLAQKDVQDILEIPQIIRGSTDASPVKNCGDLELSSLSFNYFDKPPLFHDLNLKVVPGETIALGGPPGIGRTTLLELISGSLTATGGEIRINDTKIEQYPSDQFAAHVALLRSRATIYRGSILENMSRFGKTDVANVFYLSKLIGVEGEIAKLPAGYETQLTGLGSDSISPGLKQRIGFVRALASRPKLILFDGADTSLDRDAYNAVFDLFARLKSKATIVLATDDPHLESLATRKLQLSEDGLAELPSSLRTQLAVQRYRELRV